MQSSSRGGGVGGKGGCSHPIPPPKLPKHQLKRLFIFRTYYRSDWTDFKKKFDVGKEFDRNQDLILIGFRSRIEDNYDYNVPNNW